MKKRQWMTVVLAAAVLAAALASPALAGRKGKKKGGGDAIVSHPNDLKYSKLEFTVPEAKDYRHELSNGIPVYIVEDHALPLVDISISLRIGSFLEQTDEELKRGVAQFTGTLMRQGGAGGKTAEEFDEAVDFLGTNMGSFTGSTQGGASMNSTTMVLGQSLDLFFDMLKNPGFEQERIDIRTDELVENMKQRNDDAQDIAGREWSWLMRGEEHYSSRSSTVSDVAAIDRDDLVAFHKKYWTPDTMMIAVSGDVKAEEILKELETRFPGWEAGQADVPWPPPPPAFTPTPGVYHVEKDIPQGRVRIGHPGVQRTDWADPDLFALQIMNDILGGGGFTSRLVKRIRSDEGLAYSAGSRFGIGDYWPGTFMMSYQSKSETVAFAAQIAVQEVKKMMGEAVTESELETAKASFIDTFPGRFESAGAIAGTFMNDEYMGRPQDYWQKYQERMGAVTVEDVQRVAKKYLDPEQLVFLIVGKWDEIKPGDADGRASMKEFFGGAATKLPLRDPLTLEPMQ
jgi:predicted Zn-dependent peptidase